MGVINLAILGIIVLLEYLTVLLENAFESVVNVSLGSIFNISISRNLLASSITQC